MWNSDIRVLMETEFVSEMLACLNHLTQLSAQDFIIQ
jgi:hypothetical protein